MAINKPLIIKGFSLLGPEEQTNKEGVYHDEKGRSQELRGTAD
jgi:hypothetical protein